MTLTRYRLGDLIQQRREKNPGLNVPIKGVSREGFIDPKQPDADTHLYNVFYKYDFVFNPARMEVNSIALNLDYEQAICSSLYEVFYVSRPDILLPEYLNMFIKRDEFARRCAYIGWGSAREYCRVYDISDIEIDLPDLATQRKYAAVYNSMLENQRCYERGLDDLKLACDASIEKVMKDYPHVPLKGYINQSDARNDFHLDEDSVRGISIEKKFIPTKANMDGVSLSNYKMVNPGSISFVTVTSRNSEKLTIALNDSDDTYLVSATYVDLCQDFGHRNVRF